MRKIKFIRGMFIAISMMISIGSAIAFGDARPVSVVHAAEDGADLGSVVIRADSLNVRSGPGKDYDVIGSAKSGEEFIVAGESENGWYPVDFGGLKGYVYGEYIEFMPAQTENAGQDTTGGEADEMEAEEEEERGPVPGLPGVWQKITSAGPVAVAACILITTTLIGIAFTVRGMFRREDEEFDDDEEYYDTDYDEIYEGYETDDTYEEDDIIYEERATRRSTGEARADYQSAEQIMAECTENFRREFAEAEQRKKAKASDPRRG